MRGVTRIPFGTKCLARNQIRPCASATHPPVTRTSIVGWDHAETPTELATRTWSECGEVCEQGVKDGSEATHPAPFNKQRCRGRRVPETCIGCRARRPAPRRRTAKGSAGWVVRWRRLWRSAHGPRRGARPPLAPPRRTRGAGAGAARTGDTQPRRGTRDQGGHVMGQQYMVSKRTGP